jgi:hypothetical protein
VPIQEAYIMAETTTPKTDPSTAAKKAAATRKANATKRSTAAKKAAQTRAANRGATARKTATSKAKANATRTRTSAAKTAADAKNAAKGPVGRATEVAETSVLVPMGAALIARDRVSAAIDELRTNYSTRTKARNELRRFERRGTKALQSLERDAKKTRARVEKDIRSMLRDLETRTGPVVKNVELAGARVENAVMGSKTAATKASTTVQERLASLA